MQHSGIIAFHYVLLLWVRLSFVTFLFDPFAIQLWYLYVSHSQLLFIFSLYFSRCFDLLCSDVGYRCCAIQLILHEKWKLLLNAFYFSLIFCRAFIYVHCALCICCIGSCFRLFVLNFFTYFLKQTKKYFFYLLTYDSKDKTKQSI